MDEEERKTYERVVIITAILIFIGIVCMLVSGVRADDFGSTSGIAAISNGDVTYTVEDPNCVKVEAVISTLETLINESVKYKIYDNDCLYLNDDPTNDLYGLSYYDCLALIAKEREETENQRYSLLDKIKKYGVCK